MRLSGRAAPWDDQYTDNVLIQVTAYNSARRAEYVYTRSVYTTMTTPITIAKGYINAMSGNTTT
jgi:hypothetical protein